MGCVCYGTHVVPPADIKLQACPCRWLAHLPRASGRRRQRRPAERRPPRSCRSPRPFARLHVQRASRCARNRGGWGRELSHAVRARRPAGCGPRAARVPRATGRRHLCVGMEGIPRRCRCERPEEGLPVRGNQPLAACRCGGCVAVNPEGGESGFGVASCRWRGARRAQHADELKVKFGSWWPGRLSGVTGAVMLHGRVHLFS